MSKLLSGDPGYRDWIQEVSMRFRQSQIKAAMKVNDEMLRFYWSLGKDISRMITQANNSTIFYKAVSADLQDVFPDVHSFSVTNLKYMKYFYDLYPLDELQSFPRPQLGDEEMTASNSPQPEDDLPAGLSGPQLGDALPATIFQIPWGHQKLLIDKCKGDREKALFYVRKTLENNWSRDVLLNFLDTDLYDRQGKALTNFRRLLPDPQSDLAQAFTKDPYNFDFLTLREKYDERELKDALLANTEKFLLELGTGFALLGREVRVEMGSTENFIDLLFYHAKLHCYVVVEVKATRFEPSHMGQLGAYVVAVNHQMKTPEDQPTLGLLVCKDMDKVQAQYALEATGQPLGISSYELTHLVPENFKSSLPTIEEIEAELGDKAE